MWLLFLVNKYNTETENYYGQYCALLDQSDYRYSVR